MFSTFRSHDPQVWVHSRISDMVPKFVIATLDRTDLFNNWLETHYCCTSPRLVLDLLVIGSEFLWTYYFKLAALTTYDPVPDIDQLEDMREGHVVEPNMFRSGTLP